ncbi:MAG: general secretion pathway protein GspK [Opitutales bacterium]
MQVTAQKKIRKARRGSVLVAVLAVLMLLTILVTRFLEEALEDLEYRSIFSEPIDMRSYAYSLMEISLATIQEVALIDEGKLYAPEQGWSDPLAYSGIEVPNGWEVSVRIQDEGGKLPLNTIDESLLNHLLEEKLDFDFGTSRELSSMLLDWIDSDDNRRLNGAESQDYLSRNPPYRAANAPLQSLGELRLLEVWEDEFFDEMGRPNERFEQLAKLVTVHYGGQLNLNTASAELIELLALQDGYDDRSLFDGLDPDSPYLRSLPDAANGQISGVEVKLLRLSVTVRRGDVPYTITALVEPDLGRADGSPASSAPGQRNDETIRQGTPEEQEGLAYPFQILQLSEWMAPEGNAASPARHSVIDIPGDSDSFSDLSF